MRLSDVRRFFALLSLISLGATTLAFAQDDVPFYESTPLFASSSGSEIELTLRDATAAWQGTQHRMGGGTFDGIDCSALMVLWFRELFDLHLPRTAAEQAQVGEPVRKSELVPGDLVFFQINRSRRINHVGVYVGGGEFAHTSSSRGVTISSLDESYWQRAYHSARRLPEMDGIMPNEMPVIPMVLPDVSPTWSGPTASAAPVHSVPVARTASARGTASASQSTPMRIGW